MIIEYVLFFLLITALGGMGVYLLRRKKRVFNKRTSLLEAVNLDDKTEEVAPEKYEKSRMEEEQLEVILQTLESLEESVYLDETLNLEKLAEHLNIQKYYLSQVFSVGLETSFTKYVNKKRSAFACELLKNRGETKETIDDIALKSGFNSTTTFYRAFKEHYGVPPSQYS